jgi:hypothetical protein
VSFKSTTRNAYFCRFPDVGNRFVGTERGTAANHFALAQVEATYRSREPVGTGTQSHREPMGVTVGNPSGPRPIRVHPLTRQPHSKQGDGQND